MYRSLSSEMSKQSLFELLDVTLREVAHREKANPGSYLTDLCVQLKDIKHTLQSYKTMIDWEDIYDKYNINTVAGVYFAEDEIMYGRLNDIFYGLVNYPYLQNA